MSKSQRRIATHLKRNGFLIDNEHEATLKEFNLSTQAFRNKPDSERRRIIGMVQDFGYRDLANYLKAIR